MYPKTNYEMIQEDLDILLEAMKPVPLIMLQCGSQPSQQERANRAWEKLGKKMGFDYMTVRPGSSTRKFTAIPSEPEEQKRTRITKEAEEKKSKEIADIESQIASLNQKLNILKE